MQREEEFVMGLPVFPFATPPLLDAEPEYAVRRQEAPVAKVELVTGGEAYIVSRYEDVRRVFSDRAFSRAEAGKPGVPSLLPSGHQPHLLGMDPPEHTRARGLVAYAFTARASERMRPRVRQIVDELIDGMLEQGPPVEFVTSFALPLPARVVSELLGVPAGDWHQILDWMDHMLTLTGRTREQIMAAFQDLLGYLGGLIEDKRANPADDLITRMIEAHDDEDRLTADELLYTSYLLLIGGYETTAGLLSNSLITLNRHPDQLALLREDPQLIPGAIEELLRYVRIAHSATERVTLSDVELGGVPVPAGSVVIPLQYSANRDIPGVADPDQLDITRPPASHVAFGYGFHHCLGAPLARIELQTALGTLLRRLPALRPAIPDDDVTWKAGLLTRAPVSLPVTW